MLSGDSEQLHDGTDALGGGPLAREPAAACPKDRRARPKEIACSSVDPAAYSHVVFACGPFYRSDLLRRFERCRLVGVNLSMVDPVEEWNPFDLLLERDSTQIVRPDASFLAPTRRVPLVGMVLKDPSATGHEILDYRGANDALLSLLAEGNAAAVAIDTRLDVPNASGLRTAAEVETLIGRMDVILTTRLHGLVLALKNGVPAIALDPVPGGGKITRQCETIGWRLVFGPDCEASALREAFAFCVTADARNAARRCREDAVQELQAVGAAFGMAMRSDGPRSEWGDGRRRRTWLETVEAATSPQRRPRAVAALRSALRHARRRARDR